MFRENIELRFTRIDCLNDATEGNGINEYYKNACEQLLANNKIDNKFYTSIINILPLKELLFLYKSDLSPIA